MTPELLDIDDDGLVLRLRHLGAEFRQLRPFGVVSQHMGQLIVQLDDVLMLAYVLRRLDKSILVVIDQWVSAGVFELCVELLAESMPDVKAAKAALIDSDRKVFRCYDPVLPKSFEKATQLDRALIEKFGEVPQLVPLVIGYLEAKVRPITNYGETLVDVLVIDPGAIKEAWPGLFLPIQGQRERTTTADAARLLDERLPEIIGYFATACERLAEWIAADGSENDKVRPIDYVTLLQCAGMVNRTKRTLERWKEKDTAFPTPEIIGENGEADEWSWVTIRPYLEIKARRDLPKVFPAHVAR